MTPTIAVHYEPYWRDRANFLIHADVSDPGGPSRREQLWARQLTGNTFELCCIPFFTYGFGLGDVVRTRATQDAEFMVEGVVRASGRKVVRVWLGGTSTGLAEAIGQLELLALPYEVSGGHLLAISVTVAENPSLQRWLAEWAEPRGILVEDG